MEASFCLTALGVLLPRVLRARRRPDSILYIGAQPTLAMLARLMARMAGCPYFVNINDLASQAAAEVGIVKSPWLRRLLESFEFAAYRGASGASVLCGSFQEALIAKGYPAHLIRVIRSPVDLSQVRPLLPAAEFRIRHGIPESAFVIMYAGSMGLKQGLTNVIEAAALTQTSRLCWILVGDGEVKQELVDLTRRRGLDVTVRFLPFQPVEDVSQMFAAADALLLNQMSAVKDSVIPSKLLTYMAAGKPVLAAVNGRSQGAEILHDTSGGLIVSPESPQDLASGALDMMAQRDDERALAGRRNRAYAEQHFDQNKILAAHEQLILAGAHPAALGERA
jgi:colanic acid biosynthesis glycosyl transferase WcaI